MIQNLLHFLDITFCKIYNNPRQTKISKTFITEKSMVSTMNKSLNITQKQMRERKETKT